MLPTLVSSYQRHFGGHHGHYTWCGARQCGTQRNFVKQLTDARFVPYFYIREMWQPATTLKNRQNTATMVAEPPSSPATWSWWFSTIERAGDPSMVSGEVADKELT